MNSTFKRSALALVILVLTSGCGSSHDYASTGGSNSNSGQGSPVTTLNFKTLSDQIFSPYCIRCHGSFANYTVVASNLSGIQNQIDSGNMPKGGPVLSAELKQVLAQWISLGAPEGP